MKVELTIDEVNLLAGLVVASLRKPYFPPTPMHLGLRAKLEYITAAMRVEEGKKFLS